MCPLLFLRPAGTNRGFDRLGPCYILFSHLNYRAIHEKAGSSKVSRERKSACAIE